MKLENKIVIFCNHYTVTIKLFYDKIFYEENEVLCILFLYLFQNKKKKKTIVKKIIRVKNHENRRNIKDIKISARQIKIQSIFVTILSNLPYLSRKCPLFLTHYLIAKIQING